MCVVSLKGMSDTKHYPFHDYKVSCHFLILNMTLIDLIFRNLV